MKGSPGREEVVLGGEGKGGRWTEGGQGTEAHDLGDMAPSNSKPVIGIDLGTSFCCVAVFQNGAVDIVPNAQGLRTTPSSIAFTERQTFVGQAAVRNGARFPNQCAYEVKRLMGRSVLHPKVQEYKRMWPFKVIAGERDMAVVWFEKVPDGKQTFSPPEISSLLLKDMKKIAEAFANSEIEDAVITVPAHFSDSQREATREAGRKAGLNVLQLLNEPTAAAVAYIHQKKLEESDGRNIMVFDLGGGTLDVSIIALESGGLLVREVKGDSDLGGADFDSNLMRHVAEQYKRDMGRDLLADQKLLPRVRETICLAKHTLSTQDEADIELYSGDIDLNQSILRAKFEQINEELFRKCMAIVEEALRGANMTSHDISDVILAGGSTRIQKVREMLKQFFARPPLSVVHPDEVVAYGAAVQAAFLSPLVMGNHKPKVPVCDVNPKSIGVMVSPGEMIVVIPKNSRLPATGELDVKCAYDYQEAIEFKLYQGERALCRDNQYLGNFMLTGFKPVAADGKPVAKLVLNVDSDGIIRASAVAVANNHEDGRTEEVGVIIGRFSKDGADATVDEGRDWRAVQEEDEEMKAAFKARRDLLYLAWELRDKRFAKMSKPERSLVIEFLEWLQSEESYASKRIYEDKTKKLRAIQTRFGGGSGRCSFVV
ncbi:hypothetical protein CBR_g40002 [Chara braunii]|uniref:Uncharacterized protein n=1 Tax=Chara braunii TaxID=69332 RepID=A0A388LSX1_CHABU|nr:hypothetical protein CBR_g40002 [Chara braunii]|eukprot:GBG85359.1 hypothetical protein CBR_g40002 [Chara braunii]